MKKKKRNKEEKESASSLDRKYNGVEWEQT